MTDEYEMAVGYSNTGEYHNQKVNVVEDFISCPRCCSINMCMGKISTPNKIMKREGVIIEFTCKECSAELLLALFNDFECSELEGEPARINWVEKVVPYVENAVDKLKSFSLTGKSKKIKKHVEKHDLGYLKLDEELPKGVPSYKSEDYDEDGNDKVVSIRREE